ncbi:hypothetical protein [Emticicia fontis]
MKEENKIQENTISSDTQSLKKNWIKPEAKALDVNNGGSGPVDTTPASDVS